MVVRVTALDKDKGENAEIIYSIESGKFQYFQYHVLKIKM